MIDHTGVDVMYVNRGEREKEIVLIFTEWEK
jgi:hypothetical protein